MDEEKFAGWHLGSCEGIWRDETWNYKIAIINEVEITKYHSKQETIISINVYLL